ncbi:MAG: hypothetical protein E6K84_06740 [Thaumarchaeota archaeon]|nr:MAG: hypothetical protein E6K84_06740 [Nitrososphaerota archaeon]
MKVAGSLRITVVRDARVEISRRESPIAWGPTVKAWTASMCPFPSWLVVISPSLVPSERRRI